jgi:multidrug resistance protein, MATE family
VQRPRQADFQALTRLALPLVAVQLGLMFMGVVDTAMVGRISADALAAVAIASVYFFAVTTVGMGCLMALDPVIAQAHGAGDETAITRGFQRGLLLAAVVTVPTMFLLAPIEAVLRWSGQPLAAIPLAAAYTRVIIPGVLPYFAFLAVRQTLQALGLIRPLLVVIVAANLLNAGLNYAFIFGRFGAPELGVAGAAVATTLSRWVMLVALFLVARRQLAPYLAWRPDALAWVPIWRMLRIGLPIGFQILFEYGVFGLVGLLIGRMGSASLAGHQIALNLASITFMVPLGVGSAAAVLVGRAIGEGESERARRLAGAALVVGAGFMSLTALSFLGLPGLFARAYTADPAVLAVAVTLIPLAGAFQVFDGTQSVAFGVLRGVGDTRIPVLINLVGYYLAGLPAGLWLGYRAGLGAPGFWWGLVLGLAAVASTMLWRVRTRLGKSLERVMIDHPTEVGAGVP